MINNFESYWCWKSDCNFLGNKRYNNKSTFCGIKCFNLYKSIHLSCEESQQFCQCVHSMIDTYQYEYTNISVVSTLFRVQPFNSTEPSVLTTFLRGCITIKLWVFWVILFASHHLVTESKWSVISDNLIFVLLGGNEWKMLESSANKRKSK